jgi:hypothetical protein
MPANTAAGYKFRTESGNQAISKQQEQKNVFSTCIFKKRLSLFREFSASKDIPCLKIWSNLEEEKRGKQDEVNMEL